MTRWWFRTTLLLSSIAGVAILSGCPIPASYTTATSAPVTGRIAWADGTAASNVAVLLSTQWGRKPCENVASQTRSDAAGAFELPGSTVHHSVTWIIPNLDVAAPRYDICVSVHDTVRHAYTGFGSLAASASPDSLDCVAWRWSGSPRISCNGRTRRAAVSGGSWSDSAGTRRTGSYRVFLTEEPTQVKGYKKNFPQDRPYVYVQWIRSPNGSSQSGIVIDTTVSLPIDRNKVTSVGQIQLWRREGRWMVSLEGNKKDFLSDFKRAELIFTLGEPGEATRIAGP